MEGGGIEIENEVAERRGRPRCSTRSWYTSDERGGKMPISF